jgi:hypothetical protein
LTVCLDVAQIIAPTIAHAGVLKNLIGDAADGSRGQADNLRHFLYGQQLVHGSPFGLTAEGGLSAVADASSSLLHSAHFLSGL